MQPFIYYFCYGSNMLTARMHVNNKSATTFAIGILRDFKLSFSGQSILWSGATANIVPELNSSVHGVVYRLDQADIASLDKQELGYNAIEVEVELDPSSSATNPTDPITCRTYVQKDTYKAVGGNIPSKLYKAVIVKGAHEHALSQHYIQNILETIQDNGIIDCGPAGFEL